MHGSFGGRLAVATAILATVAAVFTFRSGSTESEALRLENEASIRRSEAAIRWSNMLSTSGQQYLAELAAELVPEARKAHFQVEARRLGAEHDAAKAIAVRLEREAIEFDERSDAPFAPPSPLGTGDHREADRDRDRGDRPVDAAPLDGLWRCRAGRGGRRDRRHGLAPALTGQARAAFALNGRHAPHSCQAPGWQPTRIDPPDTSSRTSWNSRPERGFLARTQRLSPCERLEWFIANTRRGQDLS